MRIQSAVSGSSEAVGSSSSKTSGSFDERLGERDAGLLTRRKFARLAIEQFFERQGGGEFADARFYIAKTIKRREDMQVLAHGEAMRHVHIGTFEIHPGQNTMAIMRHVLAKHAHRAGGRQDQPHDHPDCRRLAGAIAAQQAGDRALLDRKGDVGRPP